MTVQFENYTPKFTAYFTILCNVCLQPPLLSSSPPPPPLPTVDTMVLHHGFHFLYLSSAFSFLHQAQQEQKHLWVVVEPGPDPVQLPQSGPQRPVDKSPKDCPQNSQQGWIIGLETQLIFNLVFLLNRLLFYFNKKKICCISDVLSSHL